MPNKDLTKTGPNEEVSANITKNVANSVQNETKKKFATIQTQLDKIMDLLQKSNLASAGSMISNDLDNTEFTGNINFPIETKEQLDELENKLLEKDVMTYLIKKFSETCGTSGISKISKVGLPLMKRLIKDELLNHFAWKGIKGTTKTAFIHYVKVRELFYNIARLADKSCSLRDSDSFIQNSAIKHSAQRLKRQMSSESKMNVKRSLIEINTIEKDNSNNISDAGTIEIVITKENGKENTDDENDINEENYVTENRDIDKAVDEENANGENQRGLNNKDRIDNCRYEKNINSSNEQGSSIKNEKVDTTDDDSVSNSSVKFSTDICSYFEQFGDGSRCTICDQTADNGIEEMRNHLEEEHPGILISILNNKEVMVNSDNDDTYTEVVYLDEEQKQTPVARKRRRTEVNESKNETIESKKETVEPKTPAEVSRPDIDSFLNYLGVLLHNVPKESMPKLQLDVISCVLNAQMVPIHNEQSKACNCKERTDSQIDDSTKIIIVPST